MPQGPVLSEVYNLVKEERLGRVWAERIQSHGRRDVILVDDHQPGAVSEAELEVLDAIYDEWGHRNVSEILRHAHDDLAEWERPKRQQSADRAC